MINTTGSFMGAIESISRVLNVKGNILPSTLDVVTLYAMMKDGTLVRGETDGYTVQDHIHAIEKHSFKHPVDLVVVNQSMLPKEVLDMYASQNSYPICIGNEATDYAIIQRDLLALDTKGRIRHNPMAVKEVVEELIKGV